MEGAGSQEANCQLMRRRRRRGKDQKDPGRRKARLTTSP